MEERLETCISEKLEEKMVELAGAMQKTLQDSLKGTLTELLHKNHHNSGVGNHLSSSGNHRVPYACGTRLARIDFPKFNGENVNQWIYQCEMYFAIDLTPEEFKVRLAVVHFEGKAMQWHHAFAKSQKNDNWPNWTEYVKLLRIRFGNLCEDPMVELMNLRQRSTVTAYHEEFDAIINQLELSEEYVLSCFLGGLRHDIQMLVRMFQPTTVMKAFTLAKLYESANQGGNSVKTILSKSSTKPLIAAKPVTFSENQVDSSKGKLRRNLTPAYMNERREKGLCYFCDEPFTYEHSLTHKKLQLHMVEIDEEEDDETLQSETVVNETDFGDPHISVNAVTGVQGFKTMRVTGSYKKKPLHILIDSGSTHRFLDVNIAKKLGCRIQAMKPLQVTVADGNKMKIEAIVKEFS
uniref:Retrotransposon gag domain-containing protein n=1 Tax=Cajanus cajan TaxID=3821 RepID=A0A151RSC3_CAJCA|nr:hypothetical protein KK1_033012 [Cajanus cajan]